MEIASVQALVCATVALCAAALHGYTYWLRHTESAHLWLAVSALGTVGIAVALAFVYGADDAAAGELWQRIMIGAAALTMVGFYRFTRSIMGHPPSRLDPLMNLQGALMVGQVFWPRLVFSGPAVERTVPFLGLDYFASEMGTVGFALVAGFSVLFAYVCRSWFSNHAVIQENRSAVIAAFCVLLVTSTNDIAVGLGLWEGPLLTVFGHTAFVLAFSSILLRGFVRSMAMAERSAEELQRLVDERTRELRDKDLQLAHGEQLATIGTLAASIAHEINNPIAFVRSNLNHLEKLWKDGDPDGEVSDILFESREGVDRVRAIVVELLRLARRGDGREEPVDLVGVVESSLPLLMRGAKYGARIEKDLAPVPPVMGDPMMLGQVVVNLTVNALHALGEPGSDAGRVVLSTAFDGEQVWLRVRDSGPGIPEAMLPHIFDPFFTTKDALRGTGLGLAVTRKIVERHRGRIEIETGEGGTTIAVAFPAASGRAASSSPAVAT